MSHQATGNQQKALANAVYAAAAHIENLSTILSALERIEHKHVALKVVPEQYPVVGENLLGAIKEVLGDAATEEILGAWGEAYGIIADVFIRMENEMYRNSESAPGGWKGFREFVVDRKEKESDVITSFYLKPKDGKEIPEFSSGQYLTFRVEIPGLEYVHMRHYSLSDCSGNGYYRISVKREDANGNLPSGIVSNFLHHKAEPGFSLHIAAPAGDFYVTANHEERIVLLAGGVGITPLMSILNSLIKNNAKQPIVLLQAAQNSGIQAFRNHLTSVVKNHSNVTWQTCLSRPTDKDRLEHKLDREGRINLETLQNVLKNPEGDFYMCGPPSFLKDMKHYLVAWGVPEAKIHFEYFASFE
jgi:nitric oxide dioxygenase